MTGGAAELAVALQKVKQAQDACRKAAQRLSQAQNVDIFGRQTVADSRDLEAVVQLMRFALSQHKQVEVIVLTTSNATHPRPR